MQISKTSHKYWLESERCNAYLSKHWTRMTMDPSRKIALFHQLKIQKKTYSIPEPNRIGLHSISSAVARKVHPNQAEKKRAFQPSSRAILSLDIISEFLRDSIASSSLDEKKKTSTPKHDPTKKKQTVWPEIMNGKIDASHTLSPSTPYTLNLESTTSPFSGFGPIRQVVVG